MNQSVNKPKEGTFFLLDSELCIVLKETNKTSVSFLRIEYANEDSFQQQNFDHNVINGYIRLITKLEALFYEI